jgi:hypothetical protein
MSLNISAVESLKAVVKPWHDALRDPAEAQQRTLQSLLKDYSNTEYGKNRKVASSLSIDEYRSVFQPSSYVDFQPIIAKVTEGDFKALLPEPPAAWVMTRGTTDLPKILPVTSKHLNQILSCGARAIVNHVLRTGRFDILQGKVLNLNFPSRTRSMPANSGAATCGFSSGTYARLNPAFAGTNLVPPQEEIDALGGDITKKAWEARFDLAYQLAKDEDVRVCMGVAPIITSFARYVKRKHHKLPKEFWKIGAFFCTSVPKIHWKYAPVLQYFYGQAPVVEMYTATEGVFAQQLGDLPYVSPNYDTYLFEVVTGNRVKMLYEMKRGEWGRLLVSSCLFPRYDIGDMVECLGGQYFRIFGRAGFQTIAEHVLYRALTRWFI